MAERDLIDLETFLAREMREGRSEFRVVAMHTARGIEFYLHPIGRSGDTRDFGVKVNTLEPLKLAAGSS